MYKNFSYIFGLGALFMLAACDSGDKKSADGKESVAKSQEAVTKIREIQRIKKVSGNKQENNKGTAEENPDEEYGGIYADINRPIEDETPTSAKSNNASINKNTQTKTESIKVSETAMVSAIDGVTKSEKNVKKEAENSEPAKEAAVDSVKKSENSEPAKEATLDSIEKSASEIREEVSKTENNQNADNINREDKVDTASEIKEEVSTANNEQSDAKETHIDDANRENTEHEENSSETPEVSMVSDVPVISEEFSENQPVETDLIEIDQISESIPNEMENTEEKSIEG